MFYPTPHSVCLVSHKRGVGWVPGGWVEKVSVGYLYLAALSFRQLTTELLYARRFLLQSTNPSLFSRQDEIVFEPENVWFVRLFLVRCTLRLSGQERVWEHTTVAGRCVVHSNAVDDQFSAKCSEDHIVNAASLPGLRFSCVCWCFVPLCVSPGFWPQ